MKVIFQLRYHTTPGQSLFLDAGNPAPGGAAQARTIPLQYLDPEFWQATIAVNQGAAANARITYSYVLRNADGSTVQDWDHAGVLEPADLENPELFVVDTWDYAGASENAFYTEPFRQALLKNDQTEVRYPAPPSPTHTFKVKAPLLGRAQTLCLMGEGAVLGNWGTERPLLLNRHAGEAYLQIKLDLALQSFPLAYKYGVYDLERQALVRYEDGPNRVLRNTTAPGRHTVVNDGFAALPATTWKGAGVAIPMFSLRSEQGFGVGEFPDLKPLADWGRQVGLKLIQVLPINDTTAAHSWMDSYPYAAISAFALNPIYLNLERITDDANKGLLQKLESERLRLNALDVVDYPAVAKAKSEFVRQVFPSQRQGTFASQDYKRFFARNRHWLEPYAAFCHLRDKYNTSDFDQWPVCRRYRAEEIATLTAKNAAVADDIALNYFVQYHLHAQLREAVDYLHEQGLVLKGDLPIGVYRCGTDVWEQADLYHTELQAGAPPDAFAAKGQNWGFPTYNWPRMKQDGFAWWKRRFEQMGCYFDAFRIDHILGFFRIWSIPADAVEGILGHFVPAIPVEPEEFSRRGVAFDRDRFTRPHITDPVLREIFGKESEPVKREFLAAGAGGGYALKAGFETQRAVERHFAGLPDGECNARIKIGLFDLISNVILLEDGGAPGRRFHFRFGMEATSSFRSLPPQTQSQLRDLYVDYFYRRQDAFWRGEALQKLPALKRVTRMLACGEDLGMVPDCVPDVMKQLGLLSLEIQRMPKQLNRDFSRPQDAPYLSVVTPSTHDMSTIRGWWEEDQARTQIFFNRELAQAGPAPEHCEPWVNKAVVVQHLQSPAMWSIFQLQDLLGMDGKLRRADPAAERINVPNDPRNYWRYRMHLTLEELRRADAFNEELKQTIRQSGR